MKILSSQQKLSAKSSSLAFCITLALSLSALYGALGIKVNVAKSQNSVQIPLNLFVGGGKSADIPSPAKESKPVEKEQPKTEEKPKEEIARDEFSAKKPSPKKPTTKKSSVKIAKVSGENAINAATQSVSGGISVSKTPLQSQNEAQKADLASQISAIIASYAKKNYPNQARAMHRQGSVTVAFDYLVNGEIKALIITKSSQNSSLDSAAMQAIMRTKSQFPKVQNDMSFTLSINYTLD